MFENMNKRRALALGLVAFSVVVGGIIMSVLLQQTILTTGEGHVEWKVRSQWGQNVNKVDGVVWIFGLVYIFPGLLGVAAAIIQNKCMYVVTCVFTMLSLLIMGIIFMFAGLALIILIFALGSISEHCIDTSTGCMCRNNDSDAYENDTPFKTCAFFEKFAAIFTALLTFIVLTWIAVLIEFIVSCYFSCQRRVTSGVVITASHQPMLPPGQEMVPPEYGMGHPLPAKV